MKRFVWLLVVMVVVLADARSAAGAAVSWSASGAGDGNWNTAANWTGSVKPISGNSDTVTFLGTGGRPSTNDISSLFDLASITISYGGQVIDGSSIKFATAGTRIICGANAVTFNAPIDFTAAGNHVITAASSTSIITFNGQLTGSGTLQFINDGTTLYQPFRFASPTANTIAGFTLGNGIASKGRANITIAMDNPFGGVGSTLSLNNNTAHNITGEGSSRSIASGINPFRCNATFLGKSMNFKGNFVTDTGGGRTLTCSLDANETLTFASDSGATFNGSRLTFAGNGTTIIPGVLSDGSSGYAWVKSSTGTGTLRLTGLNTYASQTKVPAGTLEFNSVENKSATPVACALGKPTTVDGTTEVIALGSTTTAGTLKYIGTNTVGHSTDRPLNLAGTTGGGTNDASGVGPISFTGGVMASGLGNKTLTLTGTNTGLNTLGGAISNSTGFTTSLTKDGTGIWVLTGTSPYTGVTTISNGVLVVSSLADGGVACNIGQAANTADRLVFNGGTLQLTNAASAQSTDRLFTLGTSGGTLDSSSSAAANTLAFTNTGTIALSGSGTRTLTLTGSNTGVNTLAAVAGNSGSDATSLVKSGTGTWVLTGANTYTGATTIGKGMLLVNGSLAAGSDVTVLTNATLGGSGTINGNLTVNNGGKLAPGTSIGTLTNNLSGGKTATYDSGATFAFELGAPGSSDAIAFTGLSAGTTNIFFNGNTIDFSNAGGLAPGTYTLFTFDAGSTYSGTLTIGSGLESYTSSSLQYNSTDIKLNVSSSVSDTEAPSVPASVIATPLSSKRIQVEWNASTDNVGVARYDLYTNGNTTAPITPVYATNYMHTNLAANTPYSYAAAAFDAAGNSATSATANATTYEAPTAPGSVVATAPSSSSIVVSWTPAGGTKLLTGYNVYTNGVLVGTAPANATSYTNGGLQSETEYSYTVSESDLDSESAHSSPAASATTLMAPLGPWNGAGASGNWSDHGASGNWSRGTNPLSSAATVLIFATNINNRISTNDLGNPFDARTLTFNVSGMTIAGWPIRLAATGITNLVFGANAVTFNNGLVLASNATMSSAASATITFNEKLEGPGKLYMDNGTGTKLRFAAPAANTINGFTVSAGTPTFEIGMDDPFGGVSGVSTTVVNSAAPTITNSSGGLRTINSGIISMAAPIFRGASMTWNGNFSGDCGATRNFNNNLDAGATLTVAAGPGAWFYCSRINLTGTGLTVIPGQVRGGQPPGETQSGIDLVKAGTGTLRLTGTNNTYAGFTAVQNGTLEFFSVENMSPAKNSSLGNSSGVISLGSGATTGTLAYIGTHAAGHSTDRPLYLNGTTGGGVIDGSGAGPIMFVGGVTNSGAGNKTLKLTGTNTELNTIGGAISNSPTFTTSLLKDGTGTWRLTGASTYTGPTTNQQGTLIVDGILTNTAMTVTGSGATLGGAGLVGALVATNGAVVVPGDSVGTLAADLSGGRTAVFASDATFTFELGAPGTGDKIAFTGAGAGSVVFNNNVINFSNVGGMAPGTYTLFTFDAAGAYSGTVTNGTGLGIYAPTFIYNAATIQMKLVSTLPLSAIAITNTANGAEGGPVDGLFTVSRPADAGTGAAVTVYYTLDPTSTAIPGVDFAPLSSNVFFDAGVTSATITVDVSNDMDFAEGTETVTLNLSSNVAYTVGAPGNATVNIADGVQSVVTIAKTADGAEEGPVDGIFTVSRANTAATGTAVTVYYTVDASSTASAGSDYTALSSNVIFGAGATGAAITVFVQPDINFTEGTETVKLNLSADPAYAIGSSGSATVNIADGNPIPAPGTTKSFTALYPFTDSTNGTVTDPTPVPFEKGILFSSFSMVGGARIGINVIAGAFYADGWDASAALNSNAYFRVTLTPQNGARMSITNITFDVARQTSGGNGPVDWAVRSSLDNYAANLATFTINPANANLTAPGGDTVHIGAGAPQGVFQVGANLALDSSFSNLKQSVTFRVYGWSNSADKDAGIDNFSIRGQWSARPVTTVFELR